jgi:hypothetical protein
MRLIRRVGNWFDARFQLAAPIRETMVLAAWNSK